MFSARHLIKNGKSPLIVGTLDDRMIQHMVARELTLAGIESEFKTTENLTATALSATTADLYFLDFSLPDEKQFELLALLSQQTSRRDIPLLVLTDAEDEKTIEKCHQLGATDFISRPINFSLLAYRVRQLIARSRMQNQLRLYQTRVHQLQQQAKIAFWDWDFKEEKLHYSRQFIEILGIDTFYPAQIPELLRQADPKTSAHFREQVTPFLTEGKPLDFTIEIDTSKGQRETFHIRSEVELDDHHKPFWATGTLQQVNRLPATQDWSVSGRDLLSTTNAANRVFIQNQLEQALLRAEQNRTLVAVLLINITELPEQIRQAGASYGGVLVTEIAERITNTLRLGDGFPSQRGSSTAATCQVTCLNPGQFFVILPNLTSTKRASQLAMDLVSQLTPKFFINGHPVQLKSNIGLSLYPHDSSSGRELIQNADTAMYRSKNRGLNRYQCYSDTMGQRNNEALLLDQALHHALPNAQFSLLYQPKIDLTTQTIIGVEALIRWRHPSSGILLPGRFIPQAEESGLIVPIGKWVLETACRHLNLWQQNGLTDLDLSVNISPVQLKDELFLHTVKQVLQQNQTAPHQLHLEFKESAFGGAFNENQKTLATLGELGVNIAIDDFGTGLSSLATLSTLPVSTLKIDRSFVNQLSNDKHTWNIAKSTLALADSLGLSTIAEGVETKEQAQLLKQLGCNYQQGYYYAKPLEAAKLPGWIDAFYQTPLIIP